MLELKQPIAAGDFEDDAHALLNIAKAVQNAEPGDEAGIFRSLMGCARRNNAVFQRVIDPATVDDDGLDPSSNAMIVVALLRSLSPGAGYMLSRGPTGQCAASVALPGSDEDFPFVAASESLALMGAMCLASKAMSCSGA